MRPRITGVSLLRWEKASIVLPMDSETHSNETGVALRFLRERAGLKAKDVAELAKVSAAYLSRVESGQSVPSNAWLSHVCGVLASQISSKNKSRTAA